MIVTEPHSQSHEGAFHGPSRTGRCADGRHRMHCPPGKPRPAPIDGCDRPVLLECGHCDHSTVVRCRSSRSRCGPCSTRYRRNVTRVARSGVTLLPGRDYSLTLTALGAQAHALPGRTILCPCSARLLLDEVDIAAWNGAAVHNWNRLHQALERRLGVTIKYFKAVEVQKRGALHLHVLIRVESPCEIRVSAVRALAIRHGFGHSVDLQKVTDNRAAWYVSKYVTKCADERELVPYLHRKTGELGPGRWRAWTSSRVWGESMASVRASQAAWVRERTERRTQGAESTESIGACGGEAGALDLNRTGYASVVSVPLFGGSLLPM